jgi:hypothetical protein
MKKKWFFIFMVFGFFAVSWAGSITVTSPNGGETLVLGKSWPIAWTATNVAVNVKIQLIKSGGGLVGVITTNRVPGNSPYSWTVGQTTSGIAPAGSYKVRVSALDNSVLDESDEAFTIVADTAPPDTPPGGTVAEFHDRPEFSDVLRLKFPRLEVSDIDLAPNTDGYGIVFSYKNTGKAAFPKASEVPVKPNYRVLIDGKETASGSLFIPAFPAPPDWEQTGYFGGWIRLPTWALLGHQNPNPVYSNTLDQPCWQWHIGNIITAHINENKVMGMESHSLSLNLRNILLKYSFDWLCTGITYDWSTRMLTITARLDGQMPLNRNFSLVCNGRYLPGAAQWVVEGKLDKRQFSFSRKVDVPENENHLSFEVFTTVGPIAAQQKIADIDLRNNAFARKFDRPPRPAESLH